MEVVLWVDRMWSNLTLSQNTKLGPEIVNVFSDAQSNQGVEADELPLSPRREHLALHYIFQDPACPDNPVHS